VFAYSPATNVSDVGFAIVTDRFVCLLGSETTPDAAAALYTLLDSDETHLDDVFDAVVTTHDVQRFALVEVVDPASRTFHLAVRGDVALDLEGAKATRLTGSTNAAWVSSEARGVNALTMSLDAEPAEPRDAASLPIRRGVVLTRRIAIAGGAAAAAVPVIARENLKTRPITLPRLADVIADGAERSPSHGSPRATKVSLAAAPSVPLTIEWLLALPDGSVVDARIPVVIGRRPWLGNTDERSVVHVVAPSPNREISGVHLELSVVDGAMHGRDLDSTNGTLVYSESRPVRLLHGGRTTRLQFGDILDVGDDFAIKVITRD
jgi:hypothetical protein